MAKRPNRAGFTRRSALKGGLAGAAWLGLGWQAAARDGAVGFDPELFLLDRATFGRNAEMLQEVEARGYSGFLDWQLDPGAIDDTDSDRFLDGVVYGLPPWYSGSGPNPSKLRNLLGKTPAEIYLSFPGAIPGITASVLTSVAVTLRYFTSRRQLFHVMADFWSNVHSTSVKQFNQHALWMPFQENVIHPHCLGNYGDMVLASAKHASMMLFLDQHKSCKQNPIENYARELLELHTLGIKDGVPNFSEDDVAAVARILTGWSMHALETILDGHPDLDSYDCPAEDMDFSDYGKFVYLRDKHEFGVKHVLGQAFGSPSMPVPPQPCDGLEEGEALIGFLVQRDATAEHIARRLINWLILDVPSQALVDRVAGAFSSSGGNITAMVRELFDENHIDEIRPAPCQKFRRPLNHVLGVMRALEPELETGPQCLPGAGPTACLVGSDVAQPGSWPALALRMGQAPGWRVTPDGYPSENEAWTGSLHARLEFASSVAHDDGTGLKVPTARLGQIFGATGRKKLAGKANAALFGGQIPLAEEQAVQQYLDTLLDLGINDLRRECLAMMFSTPSYQYLH